MILSRDAVLAVEFRTEEVDVPEWGGSVLIKELSGRERDAYEASLTEQRGNETVRNLDNLRAKLVARSLIDPDTKDRMFAENEVNILGERPAGGIHRVFEAATKLSGINDEDEAAELAGNSEAAPSGDSTSTLPESSDSQ